MQMWRALVLEALAALTAAMALYIEDICPSEHGYMAVGKHSVSGKGFRDANRAGQVHGGDSHHRGEPVSND